MTPKQSRLTFDPSTHVYHLRGLPIPSVTQIIDFVGEYLRLPQDMMEAARERGTAVHRLTAASDRGELGTQHEWSPERAEYVSAWKRFKHEADFLPLLIEHPVASDRHLFAGTIDRVGYLDGVPSILDIKTSTAVNPLVALQLAAYQQAYNENIARERPSDPLQTRAKKRFAVQLRPDGSYRLYEYTDPADWSTFLAMLTIRNWRARYV